MAGSVCGSVQASRQQAGRTVHRDPQVCKRGGSAGRL